MLVHFTGQDPTQAWSIPLALQKLDETLHPPALVSTQRKDMPQRAKLSIQQIITDWDYLRQRIALKGVTAQLLVVRFKTPPELLSLVDDYRATIENYLNKRDQVGFARSLPGLPPMRADLLVRDVVRRLNELDEIRALLPRTESPPTLQLKRSSEFDRRDVVLTRYPARRQGVSRPNPLRARRPRGQPGRPPTGDKRPFPARRLTGRRPKI